MSSSRAGFRRVAVMTLLVSVTLAVASSPWGRHEWTTLLAVISLTIWCCLIAVLITRTRSSLGAASGVRAFFGGFTGTFVIASLVVLIASAFAIIGSF